MWQKNKNYHLNPALQTSKQILLRKLNKSYLQDNYEVPINGIARSDKYFMIRFDKGCVDNVTIDQMKPCLTQTEALPHPAEETYHEIATPAPNTPTAVIPPQAAPAVAQPYT